MMIIFKSYEGSEILLYLQVNTLTPEVHRCWQVTQNSCDSDVDLSCSRVHVLPVYAPNPRGTTWRGPGRHCITSGSVSQLRSTKLRKPQFYKALLANLPNLCPRRRQYPYCPSQETNLNFCPSEKFYYPKYKHP